MKIHLLTITGIAATAVVQAQDEPFQASLTPDIAIYSKSTVIEGLSLNIWGENPQHGVALGLVNGSTGESSGFSLGLLNYDESYVGVQWGVINVSREDFVGWQDGIMNIAIGKFEGFQSGWLNYAEECQGFQLGFFNYAAKLNGLQVGFINVAENNSWFDRFPDQVAPVFPILNWSF